MKFLTRFLFSITLFISVCNASNGQNISNKTFDLVFIGNTITQQLENPKYQPVWKQFYAPRKALNLEIKGSNRIPEGLSPKVFVVETGMNHRNDKKNQTAAQLAERIKTLVTLLREKQPNSKILLIRSFTGSGSHRTTAEQASDLASKLADGKKIFYCDVNHVFLHIDGSLNRKMMTNKLRPTPAGAKAWAQAIEPFISELMGDHSLDTEIPANTAIVPVSKLEPDGYNWWDRHAEVLSIKDSINPEIVLIGNSITHYWGGLPIRKNVNGNIIPSNGPKAWADLFGNKRVLNLGFGWDRTQNVLWRLDHGEMDRLHPKTVIIGIGTNNTSQTKNARINTATEIVEGIAAICQRVRSKIPETKIVLMAVLPREQAPTHPRRILINEINQKLEAFAKKQQIIFVNIGAKMLTPEGILTKDIANDFCHPTEKGYQIWADAIRPYVTKP
ncbi:MAG: GDSL-type esterase/lipase family protein [Bacteroidales bacterium]|nr:GDSL-type esterase/lipase family protein [Bacteroidales bacterium]